jgi:hypothetical protein
LKALRDFYLLISVSEGPIVSAKVYGLADHALTVSPPLVVSSCI